MINLNKMTQGDKKKKNKFIQNLKRSIDFKIKAVQDLNDEKIPQWLWGVFLLLTLIIAAEIGYLAFVFDQKRKVAEQVILNTQEETEEEEFMGYPRAIDGVFLENESEVNLWPVGVMIDNMINARPPIGLSQASLVIESITEADITRFLAFFDLGKNIEKIGPVRSARPYFAEWASELSALYVHSGGSPEALGNIKSGAYDIYDLNEFYRGNDFWRDYNRQAPHNLFTSSELLAKVVAEKIGDNQANYSRFIFKDESEIENRGDDAGEIKIYFNNTDHLVKWAYDKTTNEYIRYQAGSKHVEADGSEIRAKNITIQYVSMEVLDYVGRKRIPTVDSKSAIIFQDGQIIEGVWEKPNSESRTKFYLPFSASSKSVPEIKFNRGTTWIEVVPVGVQVEY